MVLPLSKNGAVVPPNTTTYSAIFYVTACINPHFRFCCLDQHWQFVTYTYSADTCNVQITAIHKYNPVSTLLH